ncbi:hypothetical protein [Dyadobacter sp. Leaf189]|uniref:hypothetical protein n=1 Tax=Dyadobacter sp. Leaf189 TaxID=1736295 RepID=UPI0012FCCB13|nr:hypothetical protein [Dyadobacter sp. Leaf189]
MYVLLIFCGVIYAASIALQVSLQALLDSRLFLLPSFLPWLVVAFATSMLWLAALLWYHFTARHHAAKVAVAIHLIATILRYYILYRVFVVGDYINLYFPSYSLVLATWGLYGICLLFTAETRPVWLKTAGFYIAGSTAVLVITLIMYLYATDAAYKAAVENFHNKLSWFNALATIPLLLHWAVGWKDATESGSRSALSGTIRGLVFVTGIACAVAGLLVWNRLLHEKPAIRSGELAASGKDILHAERLKPGLLPT